MFKKTLWSAVGLISLLVALFLFGFEPPNSSAAPNELPAFLPQNSNLSESFDAAILPQEIIISCGDNPQELDGLADPYPESDLFAIEWAPVNSMRCAGEGSDNFVMTWTADDLLFSSFGDGHGFNVSPRPKMSLAFVEITGFATDFDGRNVFGTNIELPAEPNAQGSRGLKASGMLSVDGVIYMWLRNVDGNGRQCQIARSFDAGITWERAGWTFADFGFCGFVNYGQDYDRPATVIEKHEDYIYMYSNDDDTYGDGKGASAYTPSNGFYMARVRLPQIMDKGAYEFFIRLDDNGAPVWSANINDILGESNELNRIFRHPGKASRSNMIYNVALDRYFWWQGYRNHGQHSDARYSGGFGVYDAPEPWGPWTTIYNKRQWDIGPGDMGTFPPKWISEDGLTMYLAFSGNDRLSVRRADLTWLQTPTPTPTPTVPTATPTPIPPTATPTPTPTVTNTISPEKTLTPRPTATPTPTPLIDTDGDGLYDIYEGYIEGSTPIQDLDNDSILDYEDPDDDGDSILTADESPDPDKDGNPSDALDTDGDGFADYLDADDDNDGTGTVAEGAGDFNNNGVADHLDDTISGLLFLPYVSESDPIAVEEPEPEPVTRTFALSDGDQDSEESCSGVVTRGISNSADSIILGQFQNETCHAGFHFTNIDVPPGRTIIDAFLLFESSENIGNIADLTIYAESADNAPEINSARSFNISARAKTLATIGWFNISHWSKGQSYSSPDLSPVLQELVNRPGWASGNDIFFVVTGTGHREAKSYNRDPGSAAKLIVVYQ